MKFLGAHLRFPLSLAATALLGLGCGVADSEPAQLTSEDQMISASIDQLPAAQAADWKAVRKALTKYHDVNVALADGYISTEFCMADERGAAMGIHFIRPDLIQDLESDPMKPEILLYVPDDEGGFRLVGVEYFQAAVGQPTPSLLGQAFNGPMAGHMPGQPEHYDLHAWLYRHNQEGLFAEFSPQVKCGGGEHTEHEGH
jgi:hypothetical protein